jgi:prevent-host-death family protein
MISETSAVAFRQNLGDMFNQVQYRHDSIVIKRDGKPVAALADARLFERADPPATGSFRRAVRAP